MTAGLIVFGGIDLTSSPFMVYVDTDFGSPLAVTAGVERLLTDGEVISGVRSSNRTVVLHVEIVTSSRAALAAAEQALAAQVDAPYNTVVWNPGIGDGLPVVFDTFRGQLALVYDYSRELAYRRTYTLTLPALPFTRTPQPLSVTPTGVSTVQIDAFDNTTGLTTTNTASTSTSHVEGTAAVSQSGTSTSGTGGSQTLTLSWSRSFTAKNLGTAGRVGLFVLNVGAADITWQQTVWQLTLTSSGGSSTFEVDNIRPSKTGWVFVPFDVTATPVSTTGGGVSLAAVTSYTLTFTTSTGGTYSGSPYSPFTVTLLVDDMRAYPGGSGSFSGLAANLRFDGVQGAARTPMSLSATFVSGVAGGLLLSRASNPPPGFNPVLPAPTGGTTATDTTAISGNSYTSTGTALTWTMNAYSYRKTPPDTSTYSLLARAKLVSGTYPLTVTVTAQLTGDPTAYQQTITRVYSTGDPDLGPQLGSSNGAGSGWYLLSLGELTLPPRDIDPSNTTATITITINATGSGTNPTLIIDQGFLVDLAGDTAVIQLPTTVNATGFYLDAPSATQFTGGIYYTPSGASRANAVSAAPALDGQVVINLRPGSNSLLVAVIPQQAQTSPPTPTVTVGYYPRYWAERPV